MHKIIQWIFWEYDTVVKKIIDWPKKNSFCNWWLEEKLHNYCSQFKELNKDRITNLRFDALDLIDKNFACYQMTMILVNQNLLSIFKK